MNVKTLQRALGGIISGDQLLAGPRRRPQDRSLSIKLTRGSLVARSSAGDNSANGVAAAELDNILGPSHSAA